ncbi:ComF family protein [Streptomyces sp. NBC_01190]|uniref:ComF family protein n=1 Tax=Streptomyces sp. NBC_01190 TaxID=2903767 RepID=UPI00386C89FB|nr:ComF family protein [Streptomyces sp. NBC_01190]
MRGWWQEITGLVLPVDCAGCGLPRTELCERCAGLLGGAATVRRVRPSPEPPGLPPVYATGRYGDEVRAVMLAHKERGALGLARPLGAALAAAVRRVGVVGPLLLVPVPSARRAVAQRGHDAIARMARAAARELRGQGGQVRAVAVLGQRRPVLDQSGLTAAERLVNLSGAVAAGGSRLPLLGVAPVVLVDDLMTTGVSLTVAARAVTVAGGRVAGAAVVAGPNEWENSGEGVAPAAGVSARSEQSEEV